MEEETKTNNRELVEQAKKRQVSPGLGAFLLIALLIVAGVVVYATSGTTGIPMPDFTASSASTSHHVSGASSVSPVEWLGGWMNILTWSIIATAICGLLTVITLLAIALKLQDMSDTLRDTSDRLNRN